jgi:hypothetical protein
MDANVFSAAGENRISRSSGLAKRDVTSTHQHQDGSDDIDTSGDNAHTRLTRR